MSAESSAAVAVEALSASLRKAGVRPGTVLLVHSSLSKLGFVPGGAATVIDALLHAIGPGGTLVLPTLSYLFTTTESPAFDVHSTPTNLGAIPTAFLGRAGVVRSIHPTHSCAALGPLASRIVERHAEDDTPVGPRSPFRAIRDLGGQVAFLGCTPRCNTSIHGVEELLAPDFPPYLFKQERTTYTITNAAGETTTASHRRHNFDCVGQRYERIPALMQQHARGSYTSGTVGEGTCHVLDAVAMWNTVEAALRVDPMCLVETGVKEDHKLTRGTDGSWRYAVVTC